MSTAAQRRVLARLHKDVLPHLSPSPAMVHDFLTDCLDLGGVEALLALQGLHTLITRHNLDYPRFYDRVYALLADRQWLHSRHRPRFFRLLETFLSSP